jgi:hypothetical protein
MAAIVGMRKKLRVPLSSQPRRSCWAGRFVGHVLGSAGSLLLMLHGFRS